MPIRPGPTGTFCRRQRGHAGPTGDRARQILHEPVRLVFRHATQIPEVPHHTILLGPRYKELLADIFERKILADDFSLYLHRPTPPIIAGARGVRCLLRALAGSASAERHRLEYRGRDISPAIARELGSTILPDLESQIVTSRLLTPQISRTGCCHSGAPRSDWSLC